MPVYPFITAYFLIRHHLFDIEQVAEVFQREKLATIGLLAASINHEIRNPLYAVKGLLETYIENEKEGLSGKTPFETSERALKQVNRALEVITKLNRFAKPMTEETTQNQKASVQEALQNVLDLVSHEFELDKIHIQNNLPKDLSPIQADQRQIEEILFNLIVNACHAMSGGGQLTITSSFDCHPEQSEGSRDSSPSVKQPFRVGLRMTDRVRITIKDTGTGIPYEKARHLFEPLHTTKGDKGTGLGLYITKQLVERNGGKIKVETQEGKGTTFCLEFKAASE